jgi:hypothetical protein
MSNVTELRPKRTATLEGLTYDASAIQVCAGYQSLAGITKKWLDALPDASEMDAVVQMHDELSSLVRDFRERCAQRAFAMTPPPSMTPDGAA